MNIHHLELFYYVARHGGIVPAVRNMPYGIQQPAVSGQITRLEESLGTKLFNRRPFALLPAGVELYEFIRPFFDEIDHVGEAIRGGSAQQLRVAAPAIVLHDYLPEILRRVRQHFPAFRLTLHEAARTEAERLLQAGENRSGHYRDRTQEKKRNSFTRFARIAADPTSQGHAASHSRRRVVGSR